MESYEYKTFKKEMELLEKKYSSSNKKNGLDNMNKSILIELIDQLYHKYTLDGSEIIYFEKLYGSSHYEYEDIKDAEYEKEFVSNNKRKNVHQLKKNWEKAAKRYEYEAMYQILPFIKEVEDILALIENSRKTYRIPNDIQKLAMKSTGVTKDEAENKRLLFSLNSKIKEDKEIYEKELHRIIEKKINALKSTPFYIKKTNYGVIKGDLNYIGIKGSYTFAKLFAILKDAEKTASLEVKMVDNNSNAYNNSNNLEQYQNKIKRILFNINHFESIHKKIDFEIKEHEYMYDVDEMNQLRDLEKEILEKISVLQEVCERILEREKKYSSTIIVIDGIKERNNIISNTKYSLEQCYDKDSDDKFSVFQKTIKMLDEEKIRNSTILKNHEPIIALLDQLFAEISDLYGDINKIVNNFNGIVNFGKARMEKNNNQQMNNDNHITNSLMNK